MPPLGFRNPRPQKPRVKPGDRFGKWTVLITGCYPIPNSHHVWARCDCGSHRLVATCNLLSGRTTQCETCAGQANRHCSTHPPMLRRLAKVVSQRLGIQLRTFWLHVRREGGWPAAQAYFINRDPSLAPLFAPSSPAQQEPPTQQESVPMSRYTCTFTVTVDALSAVDAVHAAERLVNSRLSSPSSTPRRWLVVGPRHEVAYINVSCYIEPDPFKALDKPFPLAVSETAPLHAGAEGSD